MRVIVRSPEETPNAALLVTETELAPLWPLMVITMTRSSAAPVESCTLILTG